MPEGVSLRPGLWLAGLGAGLVLLSQAFWIRDNPFKFLILGPGLGGLAGLGLAWAWPRLTRRPLSAGLSALQRRLGSRKALGWLCLAFFLFIYLVSNGGRFYAMDDQLRYKTTQALVERGQLKISHYPDGRPYYSKYGLIQPLLTIPLYLAGQAFKAPTRFRAKLDEVAASTLMQLVTAATAAAFLLLLLELGFSRPISLATTFVFGLTTIAWPYAKYFFTEPLNGFFLLSTCWLLI
ncbi:MAG: hypothetical protein JRJ59_02060, partial [Deltaproteobacteria bacterium]|nr:hypothetical protein [Deltaproteobacteria bacterium]